MKKKLIFYTLFILLTLCTTTILYEKYDVVRYNEIVNNGLSYRASDDIAEFMFNRIVDNEPDFKIITIESGEIDKDTQRTIDDNCTRRPVNNFYYLTEEEFFNYRLYKGDILVESKGTIDKDNSLFYGIIESSDNGFHELEGSIDFDVIDWMNRDFIDYFDLATEIIADENVEIKVNYPTSYRFEYSIDKEINNDWNSKLGAALTSWHDNEFVVIIETIIISVAFIFGLLYPIRYLNEINPFAVSINSKAEIMTIILMIVTGLLSVVVFIDLKLTISKELVSIFCAMGFESYIYDLIFIINYIIYFFFMLSIVVCVYYIKYIFTYGIGNFIRDNTIISSIVHWMKNEIDKIYDIDFSNKAAKKILLIFLLNILVVFIFGLIPVFGSIMGVIYVTIMGAYIYDRYKKMKEDHNKILNYANEVASCNFDDLNDNEDMGIYNSLKDELSNIEIGFKRAIREEVASQSMKTELITNVSHDLKTPLTGIRNYIELLGDENLDKEKRQEYIMMLDKYASRLESLIVDLFEISKANSGNIELDMVELDVIELIRQVLSEREDELKENGLELIINNSVDKAICKLDSDKTYRIFDNLLVNISKYSLSNTRVYVDINDIGNQVAVMFKNISKTEMNFTPDEIVERFKRGDKSRSESGSGVGLAIVQSFAEAMDIGFRIETDGDLFKAILIFNKINN